MVQNGLSGCPHWCSNLVPPLATKNRPSELICVAQMLFLACFGPILVHVRPHLGLSRSCKRPKLVCLDVSNVVPNFFHLFQPQIGPLSWFLWPKRLFLVYFGPLLVPIRPHLGHSRSCKLHKLVCLDVLIGVPTLFNPFQPKKALWANLCGQKDIFSLFWPIFGPCWATFGTFWVWQMSPTGLSGFFH